MAGDGSCGFGGGLSSTCAVEHYEASLEHCGSGGRISSACSEASVILPFAGQLEWPLQWLDKEETLNRTYSYKSMLQSVTSPLLFD